MCNVIFNSFSFFFLVSSVFCDLFSFLVYFLVSCSLVKLLSTVNTLWTLLNNSYRSAQHQTSPFIGHGLLWTILLSNTFAFRLNYSITRSLKYRIINMSAPHGCRLSTQFAVFYPLILVHFVVARVQGNSMILDWLPLFKCYQLLLFFDERWRFTTIFEHWTVCVYKCGANLQL